MFYFLFYVLSFVNLSILSKSFCINRRLLLFFLILPRNSKKKNVSRFCLTLLITNKSYLQIFINYQRKSNFNILWFIVDFFSVGQDSLSLLQSLYAVPKNEKVNEQQKSVYSANHQECCTNVMFLPCNHDSIISAKL